MGLPSYALQLAAPAIHNAKLLGSAASSSPPLPPRMRTHTLTNPSLRRSRRRFASSVDETAGRVARRHSRTSAWPRAATRDFAPLVATAVGGGRDCGLARIVVAKATITENRANKGTDNAVKGTDNAVKGTDNEGSTCAA